MSWQRLRSLKLGPPGWVAAARAGYRRLEFFLRAGLWVLDVPALPLRRRAGVNLLKIGYIVVTGFSRNRCALQAAALTFVTLMSVVPFLALLLAAAKGLKFDQELTAWASAQAAAMPEQVGVWIAEVLKLVARTNFLALGAVGCALMLWTALAVLGHVEVTLNAIWGVREDRSLPVKFRDYLGVLLVAPLLLLLVTTMNTALASAQVARLVQDYLGGLYLVYAVLLRLAGLAGTVLALFCVYVFLPNTKVRWRPAFWGALGAGLLWLGWQKFCLNFQFWLTGYNTIYGAFASLPVGLFWLNVNWLIVLLGAQLGYACHSYAGYTLEAEVARVSFGLRRRLAFRVMFEVAQTYATGRGAWHAAEFQLGQHVPASLLQTVLEQLRDRGLLLEAGAGGWVPARDLRQLTLADVEQAVTGSLGGVFAHLAAVPPALETALAESDEALRASLAGRTFADLVAKGKS